MSIPPNATDAADGFSGLRGLIPIFSSKIRPFHSQYLQAISGTLYAVKGIVAAEKPGTNPLVPPKWGGKALRVKCLTQQG